MKKRVGSVLTLSFVIFILLTSSAGAQRYENQGAGVSAVFESTNNRGDVMFYASPGVNVVVDSTHRQFIAVGWNSQAVGKVRGCAYRIDSDTNKVGKKPIMTMNDVPTDTLPDGFE